MKYFLKPKYLSVTLGVRVSTVRSLPVKTVLEMLSQLALIEIQQTFFKALILWNFNRIHPHQKWLSPWQFRRHSYHVSSCRAQKGSIDAPQALHRQLIIISVRELSVVNECRIAITITITRLRRMKHRGAISWVGSVLKSFIVSTSARSFSTVRGMPTAQMKWTLLFSFWTLNITLNFEYYIANTSNQDANITSTSTRLYSFLKLH